MLIEKDWISFGHKFADRWGLNRQKEVFLTMLLKLGVFCINYYMIVIWLRCDQLDGDPKEVAPIFTQFLECVWQLTEQFPQVCGSVSALCNFYYVWAGVISCPVGTFIDHVKCSPSCQAFEFSEWFLLQIHEHVHSCQYGNFLGNNQRQREELQWVQRKHVCREVGLENNLSLISAFPASLSSKR